MRVSTKEMQLQTVQAMLDQQAQINRTQNQLSSGKRILTPADDPSGSTQVLSLGQVIDTTNQYQRNADAATARLNIEDSTLSSAVDLLQRARELAVQGNNGTENAASRKAIATEVRQLADSMMGLANTKDSNGEYLFAGYKTQQQPFSSNGAGTYTYNGDQGQRSVQIGPTRQIATSDSGQNVFMNIPGGSGSVFSMLNKLASDMESNSPDPSSITDMDTAIKNLSGVRAAVGARLNAIDLQKNANDSAVLQYQTAQSKIQDLDYASAISQLNLQMTGLQAAQQSYIKVQGLSLFNYLR